MLKLYQTRQEIQAKLLVTEVSEMTIEASPELTDPPELDLQVGTLTTK